MSSTSLVWKRLNYSYVNGFPILSYTLTVLNVLPLTFSRFLVGINVLLGMIISYFYHRPSVTILRASAWVIGCPLLAIREFKAALEPGEEVIGKYDSLIADFLSAFSRGSYGLLA